MNIVWRVTCEPSPTPSMLREAMSTGMQTSPDPVAENQSTARGSWIPLVDVLKTVKFVGLCSMEMSTAAVGIDREYVI